MSRMKRYAPVRPVTDWDEVPVIFDAPMAARILGKSYEWVTRRCKEGYLPAFKDGNEWRFEKQSFIEYIRSLQVIPLNQNKVQCI